MLMGDRPLAIDLAKADGRAQPHIDFLSVCLRSAEQVEAVAESYVIARGDGQVANLVANRPLPRGKPLLQAIPIERIRPAYLRGGAMTNCTRSAA